MTRANIQDSYRENYNQIAQDHVAYALEHDGGNPFMPPDMVETFEAATDALVRRHVTEGGRVLDAGCGTGSLLARLDGYERVGIDMSEDYINYARGRSRTADLDLVAMQIGHATATLLGRFDAVLCTDVLEHVLDEHAVLRILHTMLKPGAVLIVRVPYAEDLSVYWPTPNSPYEYVHLRRFDMPTLGLLLEKIHGFEIMEFDTVAYPGWDELHCVAQKPG